MRLPGKLSRSLYFYQIVKGSSSGRCESSSSLIILMEHFIPPFASSVQLTTSRRLPGAMPFFSLLWKKASPSLAAAGVARHAMSVRKASRFKVLMGAIFSI